MFAIFHYNYHYQGQGNWLVGQVFNLIFVGLLATESACTFLDVKTDRDCKTQIFYRKYSWVSFN